VSRGVLFIT